MVRTLALIMGLSAFLVAGTAQAGADPADSCKASKAKDAGKKAAGLLKVFGKNIKKPDTAKLMAGISKAQSKLTKGFNKAEGKGGCLTTGDVGAIEAKVDAFAADAIGEIAPPAQFCGNNIVDGAEQCDGTDDSACVGLCQVNCTCPVAICGNDVQEPGETCDDWGNQGSCAGGEICNSFCECQTDAVCACGAFTQYSYTTAPPTLLGDICGSTDGAAPVDQLVCSGLYIGGGGGGLPVPSLVPDQGQNLFNIDFCNGTNLGLTHTTSTETGNARNCSAGSVCTGGGNEPCAEDTDCPAVETCDICYFGAPLPIFDALNGALSTCVINTITRDSLGGLDCSTGDSFIDQPLNSKVHLPGIDQSATIPGRQPCPVCVGGLCEGGPNNGLACTPASTQYDLYTCCNGGLDSGVPCTDNSECSSNSCVPGCSLFPTTHDCPPGPAQDSGDIPVPFALTTGTDTANDDVAAGYICGWCRDLSVENTGCFEGEEESADLVPVPCPASSVIDCGQGTGNTECHVVSCRNNADCQAPYETCAQRTIGAYRDPTVTTQTETGTPMGDLTDGLPHFGIVSDSFCIANSFSGAIDAQADLGGPGAVSLPGNGQLLP